MRMMLDAVMVVGGGHSGGANNEDSGSGSSGVSGGGDGAGKDSDYGCNDAGAVVMSEVMGTEAVLVMRVMVNSCG